jgi:hypothetical protein
MSKYLQNINIFMLLNVIFNDYQTICGVFRAFSMFPDPLFSRPSPLSSSLITSIGTTSNGLSTLDISCQRKIQLIRISVLSPW